MLKPDHPDKKRRPQFAAEAPYYTVVSTETTTGTVADLGMLVNSPPQTVVCAVLVKPHQWCGSVSPRSQSRERPAKGPHSVAPPWETDQMRRNMSRELRTKELRSILAEFNGASLSWQAANHRYCLLVCMDLAYSIGCL